MARHNGVQKPRKFARVVRNEPSPLDNVNQDEINIKIRNLEERSRGPQDENINRAVGALCLKKMTMSSKVVAFSGCRRYTHEEAYWISRTEVEADFLRPYLQGVMQIYDGYFRRLPKNLSSREVEEVWDKIIEPLWKDRLRRVEDNLKSEYQGDDLSYLQERIGRFEKSAERIHEQALNHWQEKIAEAVSAEKFGQIKSHNASTKKYGRDSDPIAKAVKARVRKSAYAHAYVTMCEWLDAGNTPAVFIREHQQFLADWCISDNYAFKMFNRIKRWRKEGIKPARTGPGGPTKESC
ncbi:MAG TPA: hypothetical protein VKV95_19200 [Terriglobia bacterium]|nr:hypothetical protein [Terriglobia bacterium]